MSEALLKLENVTAGYGGAVVIDDVSLTIEDGGGLALLGRNGVGKSSLIQTIIGLTKQTAGRIIWRGNDITQMKPHDRARAGIGWVPQERDVFQSLSVLENMSVVARPGFWDVPKVFGLFPRLKERADNKGNQLSGGEQQMLAIGRTLMTNPLLLLLDEPLEGLAPIVVEELTAAIARMKSESGVALVMVEQHAAAALQATDTAIILDRGRVVWQGGSESLLADQAVMDRFIGLNVG